MSEGRGARSGRRLATRMLQAAVAIILLVLVWRLADGPDAARILATAQPVWLVLAAALLVTHTVLAALRWRVTARPLGIALTRRQAVAEYFLSQLVNSALPGGVLGDAGRAARSRHHAGLGTAAGAVVIERTVGQLALLAALGIAFVVTLSTPSGVDWPAPVALTVAGVLAAACVAAIVLAIVVRRAPRRSGRLVARMADGVRRSVATPGVSRSQALLSVGTTVCILAAFACCGAAIGAPLPFAAIFAVVPLVLLAMLVPISIGGWGVREGAAVALLPIAGLAAAEALAASVAFGIVALAAALPGLAALWVANATAPAGSMAGSEHAESQHPPRTTLAEES